MSIENGGILNDNDHDHGSWVVVGIQGNHPKTSVIDGSDLGQQYVITKNSSKNVHDHWNYHIFVNQNKHYS